MMDSDNNAAAKLGPLCVELMRELYEARCERDSYREVAQLAIHALADLTRQHRRQTERYHELLNERRKRAA